jgi:large subunit ribosomal protein L29
MATNKVEFKNSIKEMTIEVLTARILEEEMRLKKLQFAHAVTPLENPMSIRALGRDISRLKTELRKRQLSA